MLKKTGSRSFETWQLGSSEFPPSLEFDVDGSGFALLKPTSDGGMRIELDIGEARALAKLLTAALGSDRRRTCVDLHEAEDG